MIRALTTLFSRTPAPSPAVAVRRYEAASGGRRMSGVVPMPTQNPAIMAARGRLAAVARGLVANNGLAASAVTVWASSLAGDGIKPQSDHPDPAVRADLNARWNRWTDRADADGLSDFYGQQDTVGRRLPVDGETIGVMLTDAAGYLAIRLIDADQVAPDLAREMGSAGRVVAGVEFDAVGRRVAYHITRNRPGLPLAPLASGYDVVRVPAEDVLHVFRVETPGQVRGMSWFAPVVLRLLERDKAVDAHLLRQQIAAMLAGFVVEPNADRPVFGEAAPDGLGGLVGGLEPGTLKVLDPGQDVRFSEPAEIGAEAIEFLRITAQEIAAGLGIPFELMTGDLGQVNYSSARVGLVEFRRRCEAIQHNTIVYQWCRRIWRRWVLLEVLSGRLDAPGFLEDPEPYYAARWMTPRFPWVDPLKDAQAEAMAINAGLMSRRQAVAARGYDLEVLDREIAEDDARAAALGLTFPRGPVPTLPAADPAEAA